MESNPNENPVARALNQVMNLFGKGWALVDDLGFGAERFISSYGRNGEFLWKFDTELTNENFKSVSTIVVIWDGKPQAFEMGGVILDRHLNPLSWAVAAMKRHDNLNVVILDVNRQQHRKRNYFYGVVEAIKIEQMPWLRLLPLTDFGGFLSEYFDGNGLPKKFDYDVASRKEILRMLSHQMCEELTREGGENDRHAIQNIVGPLVLLGRKYLTEKGVAERALLQLFEATELMPKDLIKESQPINKIKEGSWGDKSLRLLLVDDQADCGWTDWVRSTLPMSKPNLVMFDASDVITRPEVLLDRLDAELKLLGNAIDRRFELQLLGETNAKMPNTSLPKDRQPVLLLDLRLHSMRS
ncbi:MAG: hypothetical protein ACREGC_01735, partial [Minisyncoccia bacterium]